MDNKCILVSFQPFVKKQNVMIYENGLCTNVTEIELDNLVKYIKAISKEKNIKEINLCGNEMFLSKYQKDLLTNFDYEDIAVNIIGR